MMFLSREPAPLLAISQPTHAVVAGALLRAWRTPLPPALLLAAEQHDLAWFDWERAPTFDLATGLPTLFFHVGAAAHAPLWTRAVEQALVAWGRHVALLVSRHGSLIYTRFSTHHQASAANAAAAAAYLAAQAPRQEAWAADLGVGDEAVERESGLLALADTLSLGLCGALPLPLDVSGPGPEGGTCPYRLERPGPDGVCTLAPWPFRDDDITIAIDAMPIEGGRFDDEAAMRRWVEAGVRLTTQIRLVKGT